jgi:hypothetical protein
MALRKNAKINKRKPLSAHPQNKYKDPVLVTFSTEREVRDAFIEAYRGNASAMITDFMQQAAKMPNRIIFEMDFNQREPPPDDPWEGMYVFKMDLETKSKILGAYKSLRDAEKQTGIPYRSIGHCCEGSTKSCRGFWWRWRVPGPQREPKKTPFN